MLKIICPKCETITYLPNERYFPRYYCAHFLPIVVMANEGREMSETDPIEKVLCKILLMS